MLSKSNWREEMRLFRLNNPSYRALFVLFAVVKWCLYLAGALLLVVFCWHIINPRTPVLQGQQASFELDNVATTVVSQNASSKSLSRAATGLTTGTEHELPEKMSQARIDYLKNFASRVREQKLGATATEQSENPPDLSAVPVSRELIVNTVTQPAKIEAMIIPATARDDGRTVLNSTGIDRRDIEDVENSSLHNSPRQISYTSRNKAYQTSQWVLAQNGTHYTIQIGSTVNRPFLLQFIDSLPDDRDAALFRHRINRWNREQYVLTYGSFDSYEEASAALAGLSQSIRRFGAYVQLFKPIQSDIRRLQTVTAQVRRDQGSGNSAVDQ